MHPTEISDFEARPVKLKNKAIIFREFKNRNFLEMMKCRTVKWTITYSNLAQNGQMCALSDANKQTKKEYALTHIEEQFPEVYHGI